MKLTREFVSKYEELMGEDAGSALVYVTNELQETKNPEVYIYIGDALMALDDFEGAVDAINEGLEKGIENVSFANSLKGEALFYLERYEESRIVFTELLKENPNSFFAVAYLTDIDIKLKKYDEGIKRAERVLSSGTLSNRDSAHIETNIGWIKLKYENKPEEAITNFENALKLDDTLGNIYIGMGEYHMYKKEFEKALASLEKAIDLDEASIDVYFNIGVCFKEMGREEDAFEYFNIVNQYDPTYPGLEELI